MNIFSNLKENCQGSKLTVIVVCSVVAIHAVACSEGGTQNGMDITTGKSALNNDILTDPIVNVPGIELDLHPPDTVGDVGPNHYVQMVNNANYIVCD